MTTRINVTIGDQRLLQNVKTRAAANQQALDDRQQTRRDESKATKKLEQTTERRNGVPINNVDRRPAAQTRKKPETVGFTGLIFPSARAVQGTQITGSQPWQQYYVSGGSWSTRTKYNSYALSTFTVEPYFEKNTKENNTFTKEFFTGFTPYTKTSSIEGLEWTIRDQISSSIAGGTRVSNPPAFPLNPISLNLLDQQRVITSCTDTHIYYSIFVRVYEISPSVLSAFANNNAYFKRDGSGRIQFSLTSGLSGGYPNLFYTNFYTYTANGFTFLTPAFNFDPYTFTYTDLAIYAKCDIKSKAIQTRYVTLSDLADADPVFSSSASNGSTAGAYYYFYSSLDSTDPHYALFQAHLSQYSPTSVAKTRAYLYNPSLWPSTFNYNKTTGTAYIIADPASGYTGSLRSLLTYKFPANTAYTNLLPFFGGTTSFTRSYLESLEFTFVEEYDISTGGSIYSTAFPFSIPNG